MENLVEFMFGTNFMALGSALCSKNLIEDFLPMQARIFSLKMLLMTF
jgi:hypothetical protein